ncbi:MAG: hypothetical protein C0445_13780 [Polaromonas sp.]|nr:hypothetical protein [Polaromonas sp.]
MATNPTWWHQQTPIVDPLQALRVAAECLGSGQPVPLPEGRLVAKALRQYLDGKKDITANLGLRPRAGGRHEDPLVLERTHERNQHIRAAYDSHPGQTQTAKAEGVAQLLHAPELPQQITEADVFAYVLKLRRDFGSDLPTSARQVLRIAQGDTLAAKRKTGKP